MPGVHTKQRYKCKQCGCNFIVGDAREKVSPEGKALAVLLYTSGKYGYSFIARLLGIFLPTVLYWIRNIASRLPEPKIEETIQDSRMWHLKKTKNMDPAGVGLCAKANRRMVYWRAFR